MCCHKVKQQSGGCSTGNGLYMDPQANQPKMILLGGHEEELVTAVSAMLKEHGVSTDQVYQRAKGFISKVGAQEVHAAVVSSRPWQAIKRLANECKPAFRLVLSARVRSSASRQG